jgi:DNA modification methylase
MLCHLVLTRLPPGYSLKEGIMNDQFNDTDSGVEEVLDDIVDLEEYAKAGKQPPLAKGYRIRVNGDAYVVNKPHVTGREVLTLAGLLPAEEYTLRLKSAGQRPEKIGLDEKVDLRKPGIEKFKALPRDQTEG